MRIREELQETGSGRRGLLPLAEAAVGRHIVPGVSRQIIVGTLIIVTVL